MKPNTALIRDEWVPALRNGEYTQTQHRLHDTTGYCCLGVLCEALGGMKWEKYEGSDGFTLIINDDKFYDAMSLPAIVRDRMGFYNDMSLLCPPTIREKDLAKVAGVDAFTGTSTVEQEAMCLVVNFAELNDVEGLDFLQIADVAEFIANEWDKFENGESTQREGRRVTVTFEVDTDDDEEAVDVVRDYLQERRYDPEIHVDFDIDDCPSVVYLKLDRYGEII